MKKVIAILATVALLSSGAAYAQSGKDYSGVTIRIAQQYGMQYAPVYIMQKLGILEKHLPGVKLEWSNLGGGSAMNEALISGQLDVAFMGIPPMLIAWAKGAEQRIACGICVPPAELMIKGSTIKGLSDISPSDKIAVPSIGSIQHIMLSLAAKNQLGDAKALNNNLIAMANPDAYSALISGTDIVGHFASMPYIDLEAVAGCSSILTAKEAYGQEASIVCVTSKAFHDRDADVYNALISSLGEAITMINAMETGAVATIAVTEKITEEAAAKYLQWPGTIYSTDAYGTLGLAAFMFEEGFISKYPTATSEIMWDNAVAIDK